MSRKIERLINLTIALLATKRYLTKSEIFNTVEGYEGSAESKERMFERDKDDLRSLGIEMPPEEELRIELVKLLTEKPFEIGKLRICIYTGGYHLTHDEYTEPTSPLRFNFFSQTVTGEEHKQFPLYHTFASVMSSMVSGQETVVDPNMFITLFRDNHNNVPQEGMYFDNQRMKQQKRMFALRCKYFCFVRSTSVSSGNESCCICQRNVRMDPH